MKLSYVPGGGCCRAEYSTPFGFLHPVSGDALASGDKLACPMCGEEVEAKHVSSAQQLARYVWPMTAEAQGGKLLLYLWRVCRDVEKSGRVTWRVDPWEVYAFGGTSAARWRHWQKYMYSTYILPGWEERKRFADTTLISCTARRGWRTYTRRRSAPTASWRPTWAWRRNTASRSHG